MSTRMHIVLDDDLVRRIDYLRGIASRSAWVRDIIERACHGTNIDAVSHPADQAERTVPAPPPPERWESQGAEAHSGGPGRAGHPDPAEVGRKGRMPQDVPGVKRGSNFVKDTVAMERQRKLNEGKG